MKPINTYQLSYGRVRIRFDREPDVISLAKLHLSKTNTHIAKLRVRTREWTIT